MTQYWWIPVSYTILIVLVMTLWPWWLAREEKRMKAEFSKTLEYLALSNEARRAVLRIKHGVNE